MYCKKVCKLVFCCCVVFGSLSYVTSGFANKAVEDEVPENGDNTLIDSAKPLANQEDNGNANAADVVDNTAPDNIFFKTDQKNPEEQENDDEAKAMFDAIMQAEEIKLIIQKIKDKADNLEPTWYNIISEEFSKLLKEFQNNIPHPETFIWDAVMDAFVSTLFNQNRLNNLNNQNPVRTAFTRDIGRLITILPKWYRGSRYDLSGRLYDSSDILSQGAKSSIKLVGYILCANLLYIDAVNTVADGFSQSIVETGKAWRKNDPNSNFILYLLNNFSFADSLTSALSKNIVANGVGTFIGVWGVVTFVNDAAGIIVTPLEHLFPNYPWVAGISQGAILSMGKTAILAMITKTAITYNVEAGRKAFFATLSGLGMAVYVMYIRAYDPNGYGYKYVFPVLIVVVAAKNLYDYFTTSNDNTDKTNK